MLDKNLDSDSKNINLVGQNIFSEMEVIHLIFEILPKDEPQSILYLNFRKKYSVTFFTK